jgi:nucleoside-diphosphate-sugar epimerase
MIKKILLVGGCGYAGSAIYSYLSDLYDVVSVDMELFGNPGIDNIKENYSNLDKDFLEKFTHIILLAGHSSVKMCEFNMIGCFRNNVQFFIEFLQKLRPDQKLIYASSSSVYGNLNRNLITEQCEEYVPGNFYDLSKAEIDHYMSLSDSIEYYGLRFGTINGFSKNLRTDIMINAMSMSALNNGYINVYNPMIRRPILCINDLCRAIHKIIDIGCFDKRGIYNLASFNSTVDIIGRKVSEVFDNCKLNIYENTDPPISENINKKLHSKVYDFAISSEKFRKAFDFEFYGTSTLIAEDLKKQTNNLNLITNRNIQDIII